MQSVLPLYKPTSFSFHNKNKETFLPPKKKKKKKKKKRRKGIVVIMGNSLRCCIACVLPCGALDVIRIVHLNGHFEEYSRPVSAEEILAVNPGHVLSKPCSSQDGVAGRILIVSPDSELKRGSFYFLIPSSSLPNKMIKKKKKKVLDQDKLHSDQDNLSEKKSEMRRKRSNGRVGVWRPSLRSISEDQN